jgi:adenylate kinase family enzyme
VKKYISFIFGPNVSGKGTLAENICRRNGYVHLNNGKQIRNWAKKNNRLDIEESINNGDLVCDEILKFALEDYFTENSHNYKIISDGAPRMYDQVELVINIARKHGYEPFWIIVLNAPLNVLLERVKYRVVAPDGEVYHMTLNPPPQKYRLSQLTTRQDDRPEIVTKRYFQYMRSTVQALTHPLFSGLPLRFIDATLCINDVFLEGSDFVDSIEQNQ